MSYEKGKLENEIVLIWQKKKPDNKGIKEDYFLLFIVLQRAIKELRKKKLKNVFW